MMARSTRGSNQRPDTLMQDRTSANSMKVLLQRTAGPYIWVISGTVAGRAETPRRDSRSPPSLGEHSLDCVGSKATHRAPVVVRPATSPRDPAHEPPQCILVEAQCHNPREPLQPGSSGY